MGGVDEGDSNSAGGGLRMMAMLEVAAVVVVVTGLVRAVLGKVTVLHY
jgi:hypothetical protein